MNNVPKVPNEVLSDSFEKSDDVGISFLLAEFNFVASFRESQIQTADRRVDVLLTLSSAFIAGLALLISVIDEFDFRAVLSVGAIGSMVVLCLGLITFRQVLDLTISISEHTRVINRIRCYFSEHSYPIRPYLMLPISHEYPPYNLRSSGRRAVAVVNAMLAAILVSTLILAGANLFQPLPTIDPDLVYLLAVFSVAVFFSVFLAHEIVAGRIFAKAERKASVVRKTYDSLFASKEQTD